MSVTRRVTSKGSLSRVPFHRPAVHLCQECGLHRTSLGGGGIKLWHHRDETSEGEESVDLCQLSPGETELPARPTLKRAFGWGLAGRRGPGQGRAAAVVVRTPYKAGQEAMLGKERGRPELGGIT